MEILPDGSVIPSYLGATNVGQIEDDGSFSNFPLRIGEVDEIIYPSDDRSRSKKVVEYLVTVQHFNHDNYTGSGLQYQCTLSNLFGSVPDRFQYTLRAAKDAQKDKTGQGKGAKVLILCVNGAFNDAVIIGGIADQEDGSQEKDKAKDRKHYLEYLFNGVKLEINDDGEFILKYTGKSTIEGKLDDNTDEDQTGTQIKISKNGNLTLSTKDDEQNIVLDHENEKITIKHKEGVHVGEATDKVLLGSTFRDKQKQMHQSLQSNLDSLASQIQQVGTSLTQAAGKVGGGFMLATAATDFAQAGAQLLAAMNSIRQLKQAISTFEQSSDKYLSKKNETD